ncbi:condensation domain-containing protein [Streptomyces zaomyceticus]|uniref:condensation domain-containing protein n=1 Tax=Streptomyces zaomyceticus TaxID=68286 RepID=UPI003792A498
MSGHRLPRGPRTLTVAYTGGEERRGPVTMGQANMIRCMLRDEPEHINIHDVWPVPEGTRTESAIDALRALAVRHEALRTTFPHAPGVAPSEQVVAPEGTFTVTVLDLDELPGGVVETGGAGGAGGAGTAREAAGEAASAAGADAAAESGGPRGPGGPGDPRGPAARAESLARRARAERFRLDRDFPLRISVVTLAGAPVHLAMAASHAVTDVGALAVLKEEWLSLLAGETLPPLDSLTPLDLAAQEAAPAGLRKSEASLRYWERIIRGGPQAMFAEPGAEGTEVRVPQLTLRSRRAARALALVAERTGGLPSTVLLTAWCALVAHRTAQTACVAAVPTSNRYHSRLTRSVNTLSQDALLSLDVQVPTFDALLKKSWGGALDAYRHSQFDAVRLWEMIGRTTFERGSQFARDVVFNDVSTLPSTVAQVASARPEETVEPELELSWGPDQVLPTRVLTFVYATEPLIHLALWADPALFGRAEAEGFLTGLVRLLESAATDDVPLSSLTEVTGVRPVERGPLWCRVDGSWTSPPLVAETLSGALGGLPVHVTVEASYAYLPAERALTAFIAAGDTPLTPAEAHTALMDALPGRPGVLAPRRYVIVQDPPAEADRSSAWLRQEILREGTGRDRRM